MSKTPSLMLPLGTIAPDFELTDVSSNKIVHLYDSNKHLATVIMFICNHCPFVIHVNSGLTQLANDYIPRGVRFIAISSNDVDKYPADSPANMRLKAKEEQYPFPYLYDESQEVARAYQAACTPDFYVLDGKMSLIYRGQLDDSRPGNAIPVTGNCIRTALESILDSIPLLMEQKPSLGCNIKWKG